MQEIVADLRAEWDALAKLLGALSERRWRDRTAFHGWSVWDEVAHLCYFESAALLALQGKEPFDTHLNALLPRLAAGEQISAIARAVYELVPGRELAAQWQAQCDRLGAGLAVLQPQARLPWYGPTMSARSFATARLMECWAHGQDIYDALRIERPASQRLRHIAHIGATTYGWTFANRKLAEPGPQPYVRLAAPEGGHWEWGEPSQDDRIEGPAMDFCLVVTQRRHIDDTRLAVHGAAARAWMTIAQCFAGPPADGPAPGERRWER